MGNRAQEAAEDDAEGEALGHVGRVDRREGESVATQLAKLLFGVPGQRRREDGSIA